MQQKLSCVLTTHRISKFRITDLRLRLIQQLFFSCILLSYLIVLVPVEAKSKSKKLSNSHYNNNNDNKLKVSVEGQHFAMEPQDQTAVVGSRVTLPCRVMDKVGALQWTKDDFGLGQHRNLSGFERYSMVGSDEEGDFSLDIFPVMLDDDARYQCQVGPGPQGEAGIRSRFAKLTVLVPPEDPKILQGDHLVTTEDREIELECVSVGGKPAAEITWIDGLSNVLTKGIEYVKEPLVDTRRITAKSILKLTPKKEHHNTTFTCQAQNTADRTYRSAKVLLEVKYAPKVYIDIVSGTSPDAYILQGTSVGIACTADANPPVQSYHWYINDESVTGDYTTKLIIHNVTRQYHNAAVRCEAVNAVSKGYETKALNVSYGPIFRQRPMSVEADLGAKVTLNCDVDGNPLPEIEWINENSNTVVGTSANLTLTVTPETAGRYFCKALVKSFPEIHSKATIYIKRAPIITSHKVQFGAVGNRAKIDCLAFSIPKADHILWSYEGEVINMSSADPDLYIFEEHHLPEGVRAALIIKKISSNHFGKYNCTVINSYGNDSLLITLIPERSVPVLLVVMGSMSSVAIIIMVVMLVIVYTRRNRKKPMPADVIPEASRGGDKLSDLKNELRTKAYEANYNDSSDGLAINLTQAPMPDIQIKGATLGVPLAGPVKLDEKLSGEFENRFSNHSCNNTKYKSNANNKPLVNGNAPYLEYELDYNRSTDNKSPVHLLYKTNTNTNSINSATLPHYSTSINNTSSNLSLSRNRNDMPQHTINNGFLGQSLLQNGVDSRFSAIYGNPYLRTNSSILPPLPPPNTANPAATPAPPPYHAPRNHIGTNGNCHIGSLKNFVSSASIIGTVGNGTVSISGSGSSSNLTTSSNTLAATPLLQSNAGTPPSIATSVIATTQCPSGQFILSSNGSASKKATLATHV